MGQSTSGPWEVVPHAPTLVRTIRGLPVADAFTSLSLESEMEANARLIAAAPDLLVQLKGLLGFARFVINAVDIDTEATKVVLRNKGEPVAEVPIAVLLKHSEAAIAKAEEP